MIVMKKSDFRNRLESRQLILDRKKESNPNAYVASCVWMGNINSNGSMTTVQYMQYILHSPKTAKFVKYCLEFMTNLFPYNHFNAFPIAIFIKVHIY